MSYKVTLETADFENEEFDKYLLDNQIAARRDGVIHEGPGGGEDVTYVSFHRDVLEALIADFFACGDVEADNELRAKIDVL